MLNQIILSPHITEKTMLLTQNKKYSFKVAADANKHEIAKAIKSIYKITPIAVNLSNSKGKTVLYKRQYKGKKINWKKAIVTLSPKDSIKEFSVK